MRRLFKEGDRVVHVSRGWGSIKQVMCPPFDLFRPIVVQHDDDRAGDFAYYWPDGTEHVYDLWPSLFHDIPVFEERHDV